LTSSILHIYHTDISFRKQQPSPARREESEVAAMDSFTGRLAVVTGGGSGMGSEQVGQDAAWLDRLVRA
jgi:hypothetical protein